MGAVKGRYMSDALVKSIEKGQAGRVKVETVRAHIAQEMNKKGMRMKKGKRTDGPRTRDLATTERRYTTIGKGEENTNTMHDMVRRIRKWMDKHAQGAKAEGEPIMTPHLTPPMVRTLCHSLNKKGRTSQQIRAVLAIMTAQGELEITWRIEGDGGKKISWETECKDTMVSAGWFDSEEAQTIMATATPKIHDFKPGTLVGLDFGEGWGGMKEGMKRVMVTYGDDIQRQLKGEKEGWTLPDMMMNFSKAEGQLMEKALAAARLYKTENPYAHFSPSCTQESILQYLEATQGRGLGEHAGKQRDKPQMQAILEIVQTIHEHSEKVRGWAWSLEQPVGSAMAQMEEVKSLGQPVLVRQCCYGQLWSKPTWIWTNLYPKYWTPRCYAKGKTPHCRACFLGTRHAQGLLRRGPNDTAFVMAKVDGFNVKAVKNRVNPNLAEELAAAAMTKWVSERK